MMTPSEVTRFYHIVRVFLTYGLDELLLKNRLTRPLRLGRCTLFWIRNQHKDKPFGERLRLALQELGPVWIKFGQMLSTRKDLLPSDIADQLSYLQDQVAAFDGKLARQQIEKMLGCPIEDLFDDFDERPLASASIAQVHTATLKENGEEIVIKVIRPDLLPTIKADIRLMYRFARLLPLLPDGRRLRPVEVVREYEKTLLDELNLMREAANTIQLRHNFEGSDALYVPKVYTDYCHSGMLVIERIYGIPISEIEALKRKGVDMKVLAERGVQVFFTQVFRDSFFHGDMHPGNIFVNPADPKNPQYIAIDCGIVGSLSKEDKRYLAENFVAFFNRDYRRVAQLHVDSGWVPEDTNVEDFEFAIRTVCEPIFQKPLSDISFGHVLINLFNTARRFDMQVQPQLILLEKTLLYIEGLGRQLYPQLDLWTTAKPFLEEWVKEQMGFSAAVKNIKAQLPYWTETLPEIPNMIYFSLQEQKKLRQSVEHLTGCLTEQKKSQGRSIYLLTIGGILFVSAILMYTSDHLWLGSGLAGFSLIIWLLGWKQATKS